MMKFNVRGIPYSKQKSRGDREAMTRWNSAIIDQTSNIEKVDYPCDMSVEFMLPVNKYPQDFPYGPDLDNLLKRLLDAMQKTFLKNDSLVIRMNASKRKARSDWTGVKVRVRKARLV